MEQNQMNSGSGSSLNPVTQYKNFSNSLGTLTPDNSVASPTVIKIKNSTAITTLGANSFPIPSCTTQAEFDAGHYTSLQLSQGVGTLKFWQENGSLFGTYDTLANKVPIENGLQPAPGVGQINIYLVLNKPWVLGDLLTEG